MFICRLFFPPKVLKQNDRSHAPPQRRWRETCSILEVSVAERCRCPPPRQQTTTWMRCQRRMRLAMAACTCQVCLCFHLTLPDFWSLHTCHTHTSSLVSLCRSTRVLHGYSRGHAGAAERDCLRILWHQQHGEPGQPREGACSQTAVAQPRGEWAKSVSPCILPLSGGPVPLPAVGCQASMGGTQWEWE